MSDRHMRLPMIDDIMQLRAGCCANWPKPCGYHEGYFDGYDVRDQEVQPQIERLRAALKPFCKIDQLGLCPWCEYVVAEEGHHPQCLVPSGIAALGEVDNDE